MRRPLGGIRRLHRATRRASATRGPRRRRHSPAGCRDYLLLPRAGRVCAPEHDLGGGRGPAGGCRRGAAGGGTPEAGVGLKLHRGFESRPLRRRPAPTRRCSPCGLRACGLPQSRARARRRALRAAGEDQRGRRVQSAARTRERSGESVRQDLALEVARRPYETSADSRTIRRSCVRWRTCSGNSGRIVRPKQPRR